MSEKELATIARQVDRVTIGQAVLDLLERDQALDLPGLRALLQEAQDRASPQSAVRHMTQAALQSLKEALQRSSNRNT